MSCAPSESFFSVFTPLLLFLFRGKNLPRRRREARARARLFWSRAQRTQRKRRGAKDLFCGPPAKEARGPRAWDGSPVKVCGEKEEGTKRGGARVGGGIGRKNWEVGVRRGAARAGGQEKKKRTRRDFVFRAEQQQGQCLLAYARFRVPLVSKGRPGDAREEGRSG